MALILVNKPRDLAQGSWLGLTSVVEPNDGSSGAGGLGFLQKGSPFSFSEVLLAHQASPSPPSSATQGRYFFVIFTKGLCRPVEEPAWDPDAKMSEGR